MANLYVRSTDGSDADNGSTWALARATMAGAAAIDAAGDRIYLSQVHAESTASAVTLAIAGTLAAPTRIVCGNDAAEPPTTSAATAQVTTTGASNITFNGSFYWHGTKFSAGSGAVNSSIIFGGTPDNNLQTFKSCQFLIVGTGSAALLTVGAAANAAAQRVVWDGCDIKFAAAGQYISLVFGELVWNGGSVLSGSTAITNGLIRQNSAGEYATARVSGVDLSNLGAASYLSNAATGCTLDIVFRNCKLPASWTGGIVTGTLNARDRVSMYNCDNSDTNYRLWIEAYAGNIKSETTIVRTGGASDGATALSWKMASAANAEYPLIALATDEIVQWNDTVGSAITATIEVVTDGVTLTDEECWIDVQYLGTSGYPLGAFVSDAKSDVLASAASQASSSETWTTTGLTTPTKQKLSVTFTPQEKGFLHAVVRLAKASTTVYVDPLLTVT